jgi:2-C-methyl-D-erythritol 4-phosphate cytidylyltransferase/2-C-methyl-D-erythritol 2,4-cyclodiphosphate synthase
LSDTTLVLLAAGSSSRFGLPVKKQWLWIDDEPLWLFVAKRFEPFGFERTIIVASPDEAHLFRHYCDYEIVPGGTSRQDSLSRALEGIDTPYIMASDVARCCVPARLIEKILAKKGAADCIAPAITPPDTVVYRNETIERDHVRLVQTPQLSRTETLRRAFGLGEFTDESSAIRAAGGEVFYIEGDHRARKLTYKDDLRYLECLTPPAKMPRTGFGLDVHPFCEGRPLYLCGIQIPHTHGLAGHSDADVAIHALIDALLGAAGFGDIGELFPDSDDSYAGIDSKILLERTAQLLQSCGFAIGSVDLTIAAQAPKLLGFKDAMRSRIAKILALPKHRVNIKATTTERLGFVGRKEGIAATAAATLHYLDWSDL